MHSAHTTNWGRDWRSLLPLLKMLCFNPHAPRGGATMIDQRLYMLRTRFNPRAPRGGATRGLIHRIIVDRVSILAPREGARQVLMSKTYFPFDVSILAPREGARRAASSTASLSSKFQSSRPARGRDAVMQFPDVYRVAVSILAPREGARPVGRLREGPPEAVSILAPREGARPAVLPPPRTPGTGFNPRAPRGGATRSFQASFTSGCVSILAPREGARRSAV